MGKVITRCLLCGCESSLAYYGYGAPNKIKVNNRICINCGLVFQSPRKDSVELKTYYLDYMKVTQTQIAHIPLSFEEHVLAIARLRLRYLKAYLNKGDKVLDIGCSFGALLKVLRDESGLSLKVAGVNPEDSLARFGINKYNLDIRVGMFEELNFGNETFDLIILDNVIEHFDDPGKTIRAVRALLSEKGKLFIATNNIDQPHGFLWQNFFLDHTVTFSARTLKMLLEANGFTVINQDFSGHTTYEGYHYPYQYCMAMRSKLPTQYDFRENSDDPRDKIKQARHYIKHYYKKNRFPKILYELSIKEKKNPFDKIKINLFKALSQPFYGSAGSTISNHTLPPEEFYYRRVLVCESKSDDDVKLTHSIAQKSELNPQIVILKQEGRGELSLKSYPAGLFQGPAQLVFSNRREFWAYMVSKANKIREAIAIRLNHADLPADVLVRMRTVFLERGLPYLTANYEQFTQAKLEFIKGEYLYSFKKAEAVEEDNLFSSLGQHEQIYWPEEQDYRYFFKERFDKYYPYPKALALDLSPFCNKHCDKCQFHSQRSPYRKLVAGGEDMPLDLVYKVLDEARHWPQLPALSFSFSGEPFLYPRFEEVVRYSKKNGFSIGITTNGLLLKKELSAFLLKQNINSLCVSIDAIHDDTYAQLQPPGVLSEVTNNLLTFLEIRGNSKIPEVGVHFVLQQRNQYEFDEFLDFWGPKLNYVSRAIHQDQFTHCQCTLPVWMPLGKKQACWSAWYNLYIRWDGRVSFCGFDIDGKISHLNAKEKSLLEIWRSKEFWRWRDAQLDNDRSLLYCQACPDWAGLRKIQFRKDKWQVARTPLTEIYMELAK